jgi:ADP-dependent NAD(P)H-hydrate dehydratase / NAD(P)H-hydrate epimerase
MRAVDRWAIERQGVPSLQLMERAGEGIARAVGELASEGPLAVVCGKGNNGGDGLAVARLLRGAGREVTVVCVAVAGDLSPDARANLGRLSGQPPVALDHPTTREALEQAVVIVDALLGTGFDGSPRGAVAEAIELVNGAGKRVLSVDVPSGVDASTGMATGAAVRADMTVTFHAAKPGLWIHPGKQHAGLISTIDIGVPRGAPEDTEIGLIEEGVLDELPTRTAASTKFTSGHVAVIGGSRGLTGAPAMAAMAAMRAGAGYVTACVPESLRHILDVQLIEAMTRGLADEQGSLTPGALSDALQAIERASAVALGPGLGRDPQTAQFARELASRIELPLLLDADGLNAYEGRLRELAAIQGPVVLTPHAGELARLLGVDSRQVERERLSQARLAAEQAGAIVVLKGDDTLVVEPSGRVAISPGHSPALATAGTGDVLTGTIATLLAQGMDPFTAAAAGVDLHAEAGRVAAHRQGSAEGVIATDVIDALPFARIPTAQRRRPGPRVKAGERIAREEGARGPARS